MIIYALMKTMFGIVDGIIAAFPQGDPPSFILSATPALHTAFAGASGMSGWIPWGIALSTAGAVFAVWAVLLGISGVRWLVGWIPTMGG